MFIPPFHSPENLNIFFFSHSHEFWYHLIEFQDTSSTE